MKKLILILLLLFSSGYIYAQSIGDQINDVMAKKPNGNFDTNRKPYTYTVSDSLTESLFIYFFDIDLICVRVMIMPDNFESYKRWICFFEDKWKQVNPPNAIYWKFYKPKDESLLMKIDYIEGVGTVFLIKKEYEKKILD